jgi:hypothetical protein
VTNQTQSPYTWNTINATVRYSGSYCRVWVADDRFTSSTTTDTTDNAINSDQAIALGQKFDVIYPVETGLLGYEYGGSYTQDKDGDYEAGGIDGDNLINILVYDLCSDSSSGGMLGYFWSKDYYSPKGSFTDSGTTYYSNKAEIFYLDTYWLDSEPDTIYSTLIHEFQHMINFNRKSIQHNLASSASYNEMLSQAAEETIGTKIGIPDSDLPWQGRMNLFTDSYGSYSLTSWQTSSGYPNLSSYAITYAFGSYLIHNYGGAALLAAMESNNKTDINSIVDAVNTVNGTSYTFADIYDRFGESLIFGSDPLPSSVMSFYKAKTSSVGGTFTTPTYDIWSVENYNKGHTTPKGILTTNTGVNIHDNAYWWDMPSYTTRVFSDSSWQSQSGSLSFNLVRPASSNIQFYLMVR